MHSAAEAAWKRLPKPAQDAIASGVDRLRGVRIPAPPVPDLSKPYRMLVGPVNYAGQGFRWSRAAETSGLVSARNYVHAANNPFAYGADHVVSWRTAEHSRAWQRAMLDDIRDNYTHVMIEACFPLLGGMFSGDVRRQVEVIRNAGVRVGIVGHGNDVRLPSTHVQGNPWSQFRDNEEWVAAHLVEDVVEKNLALIKDLDAPTFVSTAGLLVDLPRADFLGVVIEPERWASDAGLLQGKRLRVVHAPTNPAVKGTDLIAPAVSRLVNDGVIEFTEIRNVPNEEMRRVFAEADVILDQFRVGDYGVGACEGMAGGRLVLTYVTDQVRQEVESHAGMPLPIPDVTVDTLEDVLRDIASDRDRYRSLAATGPEFVRRLHDGAFSRDVLMRRFFEA
ncbi:glycosyltransferase [Microbacterium xylanilyticum]